MRMPQVARVLVPGRGVFVVTLGEDCYRARALAGMLARTLDERADLVTRWVRCVLFVDHFLRFPNTHTHTHRALPSGLQPKRPMVMSNPCANNLAAEPFCMYTQLAGCCSPTASRQCAS
jgi:hypothetical protein